MKILFLSILMIVSVLSSRCQNLNDTDSKPQPKPNRQMEFASDDEFLDYIQRAHFNYMWDGADPNSGLAFERLHMDGSMTPKDKYTLTTGGTGFGIAGIVVGMERGFITREQGLERLTKIVNYLSKAERHHGVWSHWIDARDGSTLQFGDKDDGGDLVESAFLMQSLIIARQYFNHDTPQEKALVEKINKLWREMEWDWYTKGGEDVLYWHWSPNYAWEMNFPLEGYNESLMPYLLAAASPTHSIPASAYYKGWSRDGNMVDRSNQPYGIPLIVKHNGAEKYGGPLFWAHYSYIGFDPRGLTDANGVNYWDVNRNQSLVNYEYCKENPKGYKGYSDKCWGLTASYSPNGYDAHFPMNNDLGVITPTAALSSFPYTPEESMRALKHFYFDLGDWIWGKYGFYDAFSVDKNWTLPRYLAIDQLTIAPMIENYRTGLLWKLFMSAPEVQEGLKKLKFKQ